MARAYSIHFKAAHLDKAEDEIMFAPAGVHTVTATCDGEPVTVTFNVGPDAVQALNSSMAKHTAEGRKPYFDFNHENREASAWPIEFFWKEGEKPGVYALVEFSGPGKEAIEGKAFRCFSPSIFPDESSDEFKIAGSPVCMGGLVNDPAFAKILPIWNRNSAGAVANKNQTEPMPDTTGAAPAKTGEPTTAAAPTVEELLAKIAELESKLAEYQSEPGEMEMKKANECVNAAIERGVFKPQSPENQTVIKAAARNPELIKVINAMSPNTEKPVIAISRESNKDIVKAYSCANTPLERGIIYAKEFSPRLKAGDRLIDCALGTTAAGIVAQRSLELLFEEVPEIKMVTTDFTDEVAPYNQTITSRYQSTPTVGTYNTSTGWPNATPLETDVTVSMTLYKSVQYALTEADLGGSTRRLFDDLAPTMGNALALDVAKALFALITASAFTNKTTKATVDVSRGTVIAMGKALNDRLVPRNGRTLLVTTDVAESMFNDQSIAYVQNSGVAGVITNGQLPPIHGMKVFESVSLDAGATQTSEYLTGFAMTKSALLVASRLPHDYTKAFSDVPSSAALQVVTDANSGLSMVVTKFYDHQLGFAYMRQALLYGVAVGNASCGQRLVSQ